MNNPKERTAWIKAQEAAADEGPHGYPEPGNLTKAPRNECSVFSSSR